MKNTIFTISFYIAVFIFIILSILGYKLIGQIGLGLCTIVSIIICLPNIKQNLKTILIGLIGPVFFMIMLWLVIFFTTNNFLLIASAICFFVSMIVFMVYSIVKIRNENL